MSPCATCMYVDLLVVGTVTGVLLLGRAAAWIRGRRLGYPGGSATKPPPT